MMKTIIKLSYPVMVSRLLSVLMEVISVFIVSQLGLRFLAAYGIAAPIFLTIYMLTLSYLLIFSVKAARLKENKQRFSIYFNSGILFALVLCIIVILLLCVLPSLLPYFGQTELVSKDTGGFFYFITLGMPAVFISAVLSQTLIVLFRSAFVTFSAIAQLIVGIVGIYVFSHSLELNLKGVALGFDLAYWVRLGLLAIYLYKMDNLKFAIIKGSFYQILDDFRFLMRLGWPISIQYGGELLAAAISTLMIGHFYTYALAAQQVASQVKIMLLMIPYGLGQAISIMIAQYNSATHGEFQTYVKDLLKKVFILGFLILLLAVVIINAFSEWYIKLFIHVDNPAVIHLTTVFLLIISLALFFDLGKYLLVGLFRGLKNTRRSMLISLTSYYIIGLPAAYCLGYIFNIGPIGIRIGMLIGLLISVLILFGYAYHLIKKNKHQLE